MGKVRGWGSVLVTLLLCWVTPAPAALDEVDVKAAIIYNLLQFLEWPDMAPTAHIFVLCLRSTSDMMSPLQKLAGRPVRGAALEVRSLAAGDTRGCDVAYVDGTEAERAAAGRRVRSDARVFIIADQAAAMDESTCIQLTWVDNKIAFEVNMAAVRRSGVQVSSKVLRLAKAVRE